MNREEVVQALEDMIDYGDSFVVNMKACEEAIRLIKGDNKETNINLKPCPLCGGEAIIKKETLSDGRCLYQDWLIHCSKCDLQLHRAADNYYGRDAYTQEEAITDWNKRIGE